MNIELKQVQVVFKPNEIIVHLPTWYQMIVNKTELIASPDLSSHLYGIAINDEILYILLSPIDTDKLPVHIAVESPQIEHKWPKYYHEKNE